MSPLEEDTLEYLFNDSLELAIGLESINPLLDFQDTIDEVCRVCSAEFSGHARYVSYDEQRKEFEGETVDLFDLLRANTETRLDFHRRGPNSFIVPLNHKQGSIVLEHVSQRFSELDDKPINLVFRYLSMKGGNLLKQKQAFSEAIAEANVDPLTGLITRRAFESVYADLFQTAQERNICLSILMGDLDNFKGLNDTYGHPHGDVALRHLGDILRTAVRPSDCMRLSRGASTRSNSNNYGMGELNKRSAARIGGEEYIIPLLGLDADEAEIIAERVRKLIASTNIGYAEKKGNGTIDLTKKVYHLPSNHIQTSIGIATFPIHAKEPSELLSNADTALYAAKDGGRNRVIVYRPGMEKPQ